MKREELTHIGTCVSTHGVKGEVQCLIQNPIFDEIDVEYFVVEIDGTFIPFFIEEYRWKSNTTLLVKFSDIDTQHDTVQLIKHELYIPTELLPEDVVDNDFTDLVGYEVLEAGKGRVGVIRKIDFITPENAILLLDNELIIPLHADLVAELNHVDKTITMTLPEGYDTF